MAEKKRRRIRHHKPFYKLWYFYFIFVIFLINPSAFSLFSLGAGFDNPLIAILFWLFIVFFSAFFVSMAIHLIHDASLGNKKFKK